MKQKSSFHAPLHPLDTENQTYGCRHTNPEICSKNELPGVCAFVRQDNICTAPPLTWPRVFRERKKTMSKRQK